MATGHKNIHATVSGYQSECLYFNIQEMRKATYNPYKYNSFVDCINELPIHTADMVVMDIDDGVFYQPTGRQDVRCRMHGK